MGLIYVFLGLVVVVIGVFVATKFFGAFKDNDKNGVPDVVEDKIEEVKVKAEEVKAKVKKVKKTAEKVVKAVKKATKDEKPATKKAKTTAKPKK